MAVIVTFGGTGDEEPLLKTCKNDHTRRTGGGRYQFFYSKNAEKPRLFHSSTYFDGPVDDSWRLDSLWSLTETCICYINKNRLDSSLTVQPAVIVLVSNYWLGEDRLFQASHMGRYDRITFVSNAKILASRGTRLTEISVGCFDPLVSQLHYSTRYE